MSQRISAAANRWTKVAEGSFWRVSSTYVLRAESGREFEWRWQGSFIPWKKSGRSRDGVARVSCPMSLYWRIQVKTSLNDVVTVDVT